jgi:hypothetical protein
MDAFYSSPAIHLGLNTIVALVYSTMRLNGASPGELRSYEIQELRILTDFIGDPFNPRYSQEKQK